jgi:sec-independent protein translocase protein TatB
MFLDPAKLLVILIVALVVLGPDKLPGVARQMGAAWGEIRRFRERLETEVRGTFPDLPSTHQVAQAVRSPLAFLDQLADAHELEQQQKAGKRTGDQDTGDQETGAPPLSLRPSAPVANAPVTTGENAQESSSASPVSASPAPATLDPESHGQVSALPKANANNASRRVGRTRPWRGAEPSENAFIPDDPSMN